MPPKYSREIELPIVSGDNLKMQFRTSPCEVACPAGNPIQKMQSLVEEGKFAEAMHFLRAKNPLPGITGRICPQFCQKDCNRTNIDSCMNIRALERSVYDHAPKGLTLFARRPGSGKKVSVVGGGPAGLTAAYFLTLLGHTVTIYESGPVLGGVPRYAVPDFRLPRDVVDREVGWVLETGVRARLNTKVGRDISFGELRADSDAVLIASGAPKENALNIPNAEHALKAVEFLRSTALGARPPLGKTVAIMGGGGVAFDCAFTAKRLGVENIHVLCLEKAHEMRAPQEDLEQALHEGIHVHNSCTMSAIQTGADTPGKVCGIDYFDIAECRFDETGRLILEPAANGNHSLVCDTVIFAVGMRTDLDFLLNHAEAKDIALTPRQCVNVDVEQQSSLAGVFAAGDVALGPASVAAAIGGGRRAAFCIHKYLSGEQAEVYGIDQDGSIAPMNELAGDKAPHVVRFDEIYSAGQYQPAAPQTEDKSGAIDFTEINQGLTQEQARLEAARCMHCGHCKSCGSCVEDCPGYVLELVDDRGIPGKHPQVSFADECWHCANCRTSCPCGAIEFQFPLRMLV